MKIIQVIDKLAVGGAERVAVDLSVLLSQNKEVSVAFLCLLEPSILDKELLEANIPVNYLKRQNKYNPFTVYKLYKILNNYDIVHVHSRHVLRYVGLLLFPMFKRKFKLVFHDHYGQIDTDTSVSKYVKFCIKKSAAYIGVSKSLTTWAVKNQLNAKVTLLSNIVRLQKEQILKTSKGTLVAIGNFRPQKNYEFLCHLLSALPEHITLDIYGNSVDNEYYTKIVDLVTELNITSRVNIIVGENSPQKLLCNYKLAVHCAESETGPLVAIEYLSQELPVIMYQTGEVAETISAYSSELLMNDFEISNWVSMIELLLTDNSKRVAFSKLGKKIYEEQYSEENYTQKCLDIYQHILNS